MPKKPSRTTQRNKADRLFSELIRSKGYCERCKRTDGFLQCCHIRSRRFLNTRWNEGNSFCACAGCHRWFHDHPHLFGAWLNQKYGSDKVQQVHELSLSTDKVDLEAVIERLTARLAEDEQIESSGKLDEKKP